MFLKNVCCEETCEEHVPPWACSVHSFFHSLQVLTLPLKLLHPPSSHWINTCTLICHSGKAFMGQVRKVICASEHCCSSHCNGRETIAAGVALLVIAAASLPTVLGKLKTELETQGSKRSSSSWVKAPSGLAWVLKELCVWCWSLCIRYMEKKCKICTKSLSHIFISKVSACCVQYTGMSLSVNIISHSSQLSDQSSVSIQLSDVSQHQKRGAIYIIELCLL